MRKDNDLTSIRSQFQYAPCHMFDICFVQAVHGIIENINAPVFIYLTLSKEVGQRMELSLAFTEYIREPPIVQTVCPLVRPISRDWLE